MLGIRDQGVAITDPRELHFSAGYQIRKRLIAPERKHTSRAILVRFSFFLLVCFSVILQLFIKAQRLF